MKKLGIFAATLMFTFMASASCSGAKQKPIKWKLQAASPAGAILVEKYAKVFAKLVKERSDGRLIIKVFPASAIIPPLEITAAVGKGIIEMGEGSPTYDVGSIPLAYMAGSLPFGWASAEDQYEFWHVYEGGAALDMMNAPYHEKGVHNILFAPFEDEFGALTNFPVTSLEDWKGKKMRATGVYGRVLSELGMATVNIALPEVYMGLQTGTIDGAVAGFSLLEEIKLKEVVKHIIRPAFASSSIGSLYVNLDKWNSLPEDLKEIVNQSAHDTYANSLLPYSMELQNKVYGEIVPEAGINVVNLSESETERLRNAVKPVWDYVSSLSAENEELMALLRAYLDARGTPYPGK